MEQELPTLPEHPSGVREAPSLVFLCNVLWIIVCPFSFGHCVVCPSAFHSI
jgi:hypothetical protein